MVSVIGQRVLRVEDGRFLSGEGTYVENLQLADALHVTFVRSPYPHARILGIDASGALAQPNTQVFTAADLDLGTFNAPPAHPCRAAHGQAVSRDRHGPVRGRHRCCSRHRDTRRRRGRRRARLRRLRPAAGNRRPARLGWPATAALPRARHQRLCAVARESAIRPSSTAATSSSRDGRQPAARLVPAGVPRRRRRWWRGRPPHGWPTTQTPHQDKDALAMRSGSTPSRSGSRARTSAAVSAPRAALRRGHPRRLARARGRPAGALDRDAHREHARPRPRPRPASRS